jgi:hypothetical protein
VDLTLNPYSSSDTSGISVCFGTVQDPHHLHQAKIALDQMGAKYSDKIQIDTTHFVCTTPAGPAGGKSVSQSPVSVTNRLRGSSTDPAIISCAQWSLRRVSESSSAYAAGRGARMGPRLSAREEVSRIISRSYAHLRPLTSLFGTSPASKDGAKSVILNQIVTSLARDPI